MTNEEEVRRDLTQVTGDPGDARRRTGGPLVWVLSAHTETSLRAKAGRLHGYAAATPDLAAAGHRLARRSALPSRAAVIADGRDELLAGLAAVAEGIAHPGVAVGVAAGDVRPVFVFSGHGSHWAGMAVDLLDTNGVFWEWMCRCDGALADYIDWSVMDVLRQEDGAPELDGPAVIQPVLFAVMVSLAEQWRWLGVEPFAVIGHSHGEIAAACVAGALSLRDGAKIVALRGKALLALRGTGGMLAVRLPAAQARERIAPWSGRLWVAVHGGPASAVVAGDVGALDEFAASCGADVAHCRVDVDFASHTPHIEALRDQLLTLLHGIAPMATEVAFSSSRAGAFISTAELSTRYWYDNLRDPVRFDAAVVGFAGHGTPLFIEVGPHPVLDGDVGAILRDAGIAGAICGTLRRGAGDWREVITAAAQAYVLGAPVNWSTILDPSPQRHVEPLNSVLFPKEA